MLSINPEDLLPRDLDSFYEKGKSEAVQRLRYEHYKEKREMKLNIIHQMLLSEALTKQKDMLPNNMNRNLSSSPKHGALPIPIGPINNTKDLELISLAKDVNYKSYAATPGIQIKSHRAKSEKKKIATGREIQSDNTDPT